MLFSSQKYEKNFQKTFWVVETVDIEWLGRCLEDSHENLQLNAYNANPTKPAEEFWLTRKCAKPDFTSCATSA